MKVLCIDCTTKTQIYRDMTLEEKNQMVLDVAEEIARQESEMEELSRINGLSEQERILEATDIVLGSKSRQPVVPKTVSKYHIDEAKKRLGIIARPP